MKFSHQAYFPMSCFLVGDDCTRAYDNAPGICRKARECKKVRDDWNLGIKITYCSYVGNEAIVCCPSEGNSNFRPPNGKERISAQSNFLIIGSTLED